MPVDHVDDAPLAIAPPFGRDVPADPSPRATPLSRDDLERFRQDPLAFAASQGAAESGAFVARYLERLEQRLSDVGCPAPPHGRRLATWAPSYASPCASARSRPGEPPHPDEHEAPRMGAVLVVATVMVVVAAAAATLAMIKRSRY
jgi:hypothetical protein